jgi:hypothetical protein
MRRDQATADQSAQGSADPSLGSRCRPLSQARMLPQDLVARPSQPQRADQPRQF